jgi:hypothetical protein
MGRIAARSGFAKMIAFQRFIYCSIKEFKNEFMDSWGAVSIKEKTISFLVETSGPQPASRVRFDIDFIPEAFRKFLDQHQIFISRRRVQDNAI